MGGKHFSGATQLLNATSLNEEETEAAAASVAKAMDGSLPSTAKAEVGKDKKLHFAWKEFRTPTKMLLSAMANSLQQSLPENWTLLSSKPANVLKPRGPNSERLRFTEKETSTASASRQTRARRRARQKYHATSFRSTSDFAFPSTRQGFIVFQHMCSQDLWACFWADPFHKCARKCTQAIRMTDGASDLLRAFMKLFRYSRGPYGTSKFGKLISEARDSLIRVLEKDPHHAILEPWLCGMGRDQESPFKASRAKSQAFDHGDAAAVLREHKGRCWAMFMLSRRS